MRVPALSPLLLAVLLPACGAEPEAPFEQPPSSGPTVGKPAPIARPADPARARLGQLARLIELPAPGPYHLAALPDGTLAASRAGRTLLIAESGQVVRELPLGGLVVADADGHLWLAGEFSDSVDLFGARYDSAGGLDAFVAKLDDRLEPFWVRQLGSPEQERPREIAVHADHVIVMGTGIGTRALDRNGNPVWSTTVAGTDFAVEPDGSVFLAGGFVDELAIGSDTHYADQPSIFIAELDRDGRPVWSRSFAGTSLSEAHRVGIDPDGNVALVGSFRGRLSLGGSELFHDSSSGEPYLAGFFAKYDRSGAHLCSVRSELANHFEIVADAEGNFVVTGNVSDDTALLELRILDPSGSELWRQSGPSGIELGTGYGFDVALDREQRLHWSLDAHSKSSGGATLVPHVATFVR